MFSRFATVLHNAVDALAPPVPLVEEFTYHWKSITNFFIDKTSDSKAPVEETNIVGHLKQMLQILIDEEKTVEDGSTGPCMEYLLHHKLLDTLYTLGRADCPPGMKQHVLNFFTRLLSKVEQPLLPHVSVHRPVQRLIKMCGEIKAAPTEHEEVQFLCIVCVKLKEASHLINFFVEMPKRSSINADVNLSEKTNSQLCQFDFPLVNSLVSLLKSADNHIVLRASEALLLLCSCSDELAARSIVDRSEFCAALCNRLIELYSALPPKLEVNAIESVEAKWGVDSFNFTEDVMWFPGKRQLIFFLSWLDFCDQLMKDANPLICQSLTHLISTEWLAQVVLPQITQGSEEESLTTIAYFTRCLHVISSDNLVEEFADFLVGKNGDVEICGLICHPLKEFLLEKCSTDSHRIAITILKLFECALDKNIESIYHKLILCNMMTREYFDNTLADFQATWSDEEDERIRKGFYDTDISPGSSPVSRTLAPSNIHKIINCFLALLPDELKSCEDDTGYENYLRDAHRQYRECSMACCSFDWPREATCREISSDSSSSESQPEADTFVFYEGSFLQLVFDKLENLLHQPYEVSLQLTSIVSKLALLPHPFLHEFLLNPLIPHTLGARSLFSVLEKVANEVQVGIEEVPNFKRTLFLTRQRLLGESNGPVESESGFDSDSSLVCDGNTTFLEGIIVLEEFCKELAAIAFVKYHASS